MKLSLGVWDIPYTDVGASNKETTHEVALGLEQKYHVMEKFAEMHMNDIKHALGLAFTGAMGNVLAGQDHMDALKGAFFESSSEIGKQFSQFLDNKELDGVVGGVPTKASLMGVSHRHKGKEKQGPRPSFVDTGTYQASFTVELSE